MSTDKQDEAVNGEDGDKAFWQQCSAEANGNHSIHYGLTKREYFAGLAMQGILANETLMEGLAAMKLGSPEVNRKQLCEGAVAYADALLAALEASK